MDIDTASPNGLQQWQDLFDEKVSKVYKEEPLGVLKNLAMILFTIDREMKRVQDMLHGDVLHIRNMVIDSHLGSESDKQSSQEDITMLGNMLTDLKSIPQSIDSPEPFPNKAQTKTVLSPNYSDNKIDLTFDCDSSITRYSDMINTSPELKNTRYKDYKRKLRRKRKIDCDANPTNNLLSGLRDSVILDDSSFKENNDEIDASLEFFKHVPPQVEKEKNLISKTLEECQIKVTPRKSEDFDFSVIQGTPVLKPAMSMKKDSKSSSFPPRRKASKKPDLTLTQMIVTNKEKTECKKRLGQKKTNCDNSTIQSSSGIQSTDVLKTNRMFTEQKNSNETSKKANVCTKTPLIQPKEGEKSVSISMMVDLLNEESSDSTKNINFDPSSSKDETQDLSSSIRFEDFEDESSLNSGMLDALTTIETPEKSCPDLNDFLAKAQNVPVELQAAPVIRGKARQKLPGWACKECETFYKNQGLEPNEILALNKCTKHRGVYKPREDTLPGYWDMDLRTQE
ncbi:uncharacterized protein LOC126742192 [Anthonomus grandis grandis]|uniref:uncharacterized protein LOC126742192 n=1 Tax=Anthonomus grandis grandis TaxID=2921223 RepID=UPI002165178F|nr:uncharacterized protein LOC126742192 [Anthonomus grandis grandis]